MNEVSTVGRNTQGVILIRTVDGEQVVGLQRIEEIDEDELAILEHDEEAVVQGEAPADEAEQSPEQDS